eukprot:scaffold10882_cov108-Isochrysis_galbana.AAC.1
MSGSMSIPSSSRRRYVMAAPAHVSVADVVKGRSLLFDPDEIVDCWCRRRSRGHHPLQCPPPQWEEALEGPCFCLSEEGRRVEGKIQWILSKISVEFSTKRKIA